MDQELEHLEHMVQFLEFFSSKLAGKPFTVVGDGNQTRDFTYVLDVVDAFYKAIISEKTNLILNVGSGGTYSVNQLVELLGGKNTYAKKTRRIWLYICWYKSN